MIDEKTREFLLQNLSSVYFLILFFGAETLLEVYTDGSQSDQTEIGGWAWTVPGESENSGWEDATTSTRMELRAVLEAISSNQGELLIITDMKDIQICFDVGLWRKWEGNDWLNYFGEPIQNRDLWEPIIDQWKARKIYFIWVSEKQRDPNLVRAHNLANHAREQREAEVRSDNQPGR